MEANDRKLITVSILLALLAIFLVHEFAEPYLPSLVAILITFPLVFFAGVYWERIRFDAYLDYLREVGDLIDNRGIREQEIAAQAQPVSHVPPTGQPVQINRMGTSQRRRQKLN